MLCWFRPEQDYGKHLNFLWCSTWGCIYCNKAHLHPPTNASTQRKMETNPSAVSSSNFSWSQRGFELGNHQMRVKGCLCKMETKWPSNKMKSTKESLLLWEGITWSGNWGFIIDICYGCRLIRSMNPVGGKFKVKLIRFQSPDWPEACGKSMPQTLCWTQRPIHGQADRPNDHSYITEAIGGQGGWGGGVFVKDELTKSCTYIHIGVPVPLSGILKSGSINVWLAVFMSQPSGQQTYSLENNQFSLHI